MLAYLIYCSIGQSNSETIITNQLRSKCILETIS